jgi:hypothetical protein
VLEFLTDQHFLNALAAMIGPLAIFVAPTEEIEHLVFGQDTEEAPMTDTPTTPVPEGLGFPEAA